MGGSNPYITQTKLPRPTKKFKVRFLPMDKVIEVDPKDIPFGETGREGSILDIALNNGIEIDHACGGVSACSTCHIYVKKGGQSCNEAEDFELDMLDTAPANSTESRLSCQCVPNGEVDLEIEIPVGIEISFEKVTKTILHSYLQYLRLHHHLRYRPFVHQH